jgi:hypothetical protein
LLSKAIFSITRLQQNFVTQLELIERGDTNLSDAAAYVLAGSKSSGAAIRVAASKSLHLGNIQAAPARARVKGQDSVKSSMKQAKYSLTNANKGSSFHLLALVCIFFHPKSA